jgi:cell division protein FtsW (lipid II flippase)
MISRSGNWRGERPGRLTFAVVLVGLQAALCTLVGILVLAAIPVVSEEEGLDNPALLYTIGIAYLAVGLALIPCCVLLLRGHAVWPRDTVVIIEALCILAGILSTLNGEGGGVISVAYPVVVIGLLVRRDVADWLDAGQHQRAAGR